MYAKFPFRKLNKIEDNLFIDLSLIAPSRLSIYLSLKTADFRAVFFCLLRDATLARPRLASSLDKFATRCLTDLSLIRSPLNLRSFLSGLANLTNLI